MGAVSSRLQAVARDENQVVGENLLNNLDHGISTNDLGVTLARGTKRRREVDEEVNTSTDNLDRLLSTPKKKKLTTTSQYIYENLFKAGRDSDITVVILGRSWHLHKLYLCQSAYFSSMFSGRWSDSGKKEVNIKIDDPHVTLDALHTTLGSLYQDEISVEPSEVIPVLAAATLFQLEGLIDQCLVIMEETVNVQTVVRYWEASAQYGCMKMTTICQDWLAVNLLSHLPDHPARLRDIPPPLMSELVRSPHLFVMQTEFSVYVLLRLWVFLQLHPAWDGEPQEAVLQSHKYFQSLASGSDDDSSRASSSTQYFLEHEDSQVYLPVFRNIRLPHLINHHMDVAMLVSDRIVPDSWMSSTYYARWMTLLRLDSGIDKGPQDLDEETFNRECLRCGRTLNTDGQHMWRWTGFNSGLDLIVTYENFSLRLKRNTATDHEALTSNHKKRHLIYRVTVVSMNEQKQPVYRECSGIKQASLGKNESVIMLELDPIMTIFPLLLSFNFCVSTPLITPQMEGAAPAIVDNIANEGSI